jgi:hypothetical protein
VQRDACERRVRGARVPERHVVEVQLAPGSRESPRVRALTDERLAVEHLEHALGGGGGVEDPRCHVTEVTRGAIQQPEVGEEREESAERQPAVREGPGAPREHEEHSSELDQVDERCEQRPQSGGRELGVHDSLALARKTTVLGDFLIACLHERGIREALLGDGPERSRAAALLA